VNFKRAVWTAGFRKVLASVAGYAETGISWELFDGTTRWLHPIVMILSADYEEQYVHYSTLSCLQALMHHISNCRGMISMTRGVNSKVPCPVCLVPDNELHNLGSSYPLRTTDEMRNIYESTKNMSVTDKEAKLKSYGLRDIHVSQRSSFCLGL
jgi:Plavaka transposase